MGAEQNQTVPKEVLELVERFERDRHVYESAQYNETQLRREFLDPFFKALGWDVDNTAGYAPAYRDVIHEDAIKIGGYTKAPDYCFRIGGTRKFFVEAKKPAVNLKEDVSPAFQLRRYAWSNKLPLSILTDFEEFAVYDCRVKPVKTDAPSAARLIYITFDQYAERFDEIASIFSREDVLKGSFDRYAESTKAKRGTAEVDVAFLKEIESWRDALARNLAIRNLGLSTRDLNFAVQATIDRIVFLRICEDRGIEDYGRLLGLVNGPHIYERLFKLFHEADEKYNSGLFHFRHEAGEAEAPDDLTPSLTLDDKVLAGIIKTQYYPDSPYEFSVLPADILGQVYEQFLGKVIRLTAGHRAVVEDKPEVKKAGGVYYTPTYIVEYIVKNTVGKVVEGKKPAQIAKLRILDPACGSGSFLVGAYQFLLDWHRDWYVNDGAAKHAKKGLLREAAGGDWRLTTPERKRILVNNIYGVDIDPAAVEVTKLSLLLKVLEDETQTTMFRERVLPDLGSNIKCGNSLIGTDFYEGQQMSLLDEEERARINPFDWETEFAEIMKSGGFDAVIGNPPYVSFGLRDVGTLANDEATYLRRRFADSAEYKMSVYAMFVELAVRLSREGGTVSQIVPDSFLLGRYFSRLRGYILATAAIEQLLLIRARVFQRGTIGASVVFRFTKSKDEQARQRNHVMAVVCTSVTQFPNEFHGGHAYSQAYFGGLPHNRFRLFFSREDERLVGRVENVTPSDSLSREIKLSSGLIGRSGKSSIVASRRQGPAWRRGLLSGVEIGRYATHYAGGFIHFDPRVLKSGFKEATYDEAKLLGRQTGDRLVWTYDDDGLLCLNNLHVANHTMGDLDLKYVLAILNSSLMNTYYQLISLESGRALAQTDIETLEGLPVRTIDFSNPDDKAKHNRMVELVERMLELHKQLAAARTSHDKDLIQRQLDATDREIDNVVYDLYGLTDDEIKIVEEATSR